MRKARAAVMVLVLSAAAPAIEADEGQTVYLHCQACHQPEGAGIPGIFPPLRNRLAKIAATPEGREYAATVLISGLVGTIEVDGQRYVGAMPAQGLSDEEIASVFNYVMANFSDTPSEATAKDFSAEEIAGFRSKNSGEGAPSAFSLRSSVPGL